MKVNPQQLLDDGFIILRQVIPPDQLDALRTNFEILLDRQKAIWRRERKPDDPPGGTWETTAQPRVFFNEVVDEKTADAVDFCLGENTLGVSRQLTRSSDAAVTLMALMCSPPRDHGPASWHRDVDPVAQAPLRGMQTDMLANAPGYVQWNIPLYDDSVFWVVPGSHARPNTEEEHQHLLTNSQKPMPGGIPVKLRAGDGIVYSHFILHWGSNYSAKLRRTVHLGYLALGGPVFPVVNAYYWELGFTKSLPQKIRDRFQDFSRLHQEQCDVMESTLRAILSGDTRAFMKGLETLHPGREGRMVCVVLLSKWVDKLRTLKSREVVNLPLEEQINAVREHRLNFHVYRDFAQRFAEAEANQLWERFSILFERMESEMERSVADRGARVMRYQLTEMPAGFEVEDFIQSWNG
jgi:ectoine hydroxylase-related dioxygenase (phytanoyl-CoA dioxygenase family)